MDRSSPTPRPRPDRRRAWRPRAWCAASRSSWPSCRAARPQRAPAGAGVTAASAQPTGGARRPAGAPLGTHRGRRDPAVGGLAARRARLVARAGHARVRGGARVGHPQVPVRLVRAATPEAALVRVHWQRSVSWRGGGVTRRTVNARGETTGADCWIVLAPQGAPWRRRRRAARRCPARARARARTRARRRPAGRDARRRAHRAAHAQRDAARP
jgi:hypothetical protein